MLKDPSFNVYLLRASGMGESPFYLLLHVTFPEGECLKGFLPH